MTTLSGDDLQKHTQYGFWDGIINISPPWRGARKNRRLCNTGEGKLQNLRYFSRLKLDVIVYANLLTMYQRTSISSNETCLISDVKFWLCELERRHIWLDSGFWTTSIVDQILCQPLYLSQIILKPFTKFFISVVYYIGMASLISYLLCGRWFSTLFLYTVWQWSFFSNVSHT